MAKLTLTDLANLQNEQTAVAAVNNNNAAIEAALENTLSRDGSTPNGMGADFDMNSYRILNLPAATSPTEPIRKQEFDAVSGSFSDFEPLVLAAAASATAAAASATAADASADAAEAALAGVLAGTVADNAVSTPKLQNDAATNAKLANMATQTVKGRASAGTGDPEDLSATQITAILNIFTSALKGLVPASGGGTTNFLRADGSWTTPASTAPTGSIFAFASNAVPAGYLECNGASVSRTTYGSLFAVIGTSYGSVDGASFNVPDLRGHFVRGWDNARGVDPSRALGSSQAFAVGPHSHTASSTGSTSTDGAHTHTIPPDATGSGATAAVTTGITFSGSNTTGSSGAHSHSLTITTTVDSNGGTESRPINTAMMYIIKT